MPGLPIPALGESRNLKSGWPLFFFSIFYKNILTYASKHDIIYSETRTTQQSKKHTLEDKKKFRIIYDTETEVNKVFNIEAEYSQDAWDAFYEEIETETEVTRAFIVVES